MRVKLARVLLFTMVLGCVLGMCACSAIVSFKSLVGDPAEDAAAPDAALDGSGITTADGGGPGVDAGDAGRTDASALPFCQQAKHTFCADFDEGTLLTGWYGQKVDPPGAVSLATDHSLSPLGSLQALMPRMAAADPNRYAVLEQRFDVSWRRVIVDFDIYIAQPDWDAGDVNAGVITIGLFSGDQSYGMAMSAGAGYTTIGASGGTDANKGPIPNDTWVHAHFDYDPQKALSAQVGTEMYTTALGALAGQGASPAMVVGVGVSGYNHPAPTFRIYYDNVTIDLP